MAFQQDRYDPIQNLDSTPIDYQFPIGGCPSARPGTLLQRTAESNLAPAVLTLEDIQVREEHWVIVCTKESLTSGQFQCRIG